MSASLRNGYLHFSIDPERGAWSLSGQHIYNPSLIDINMGVHYRIKRRNYWALVGHWQTVDVKETKTSTSPHGNLQQYEIITAPDKNGLRFTITFALPEERSYLFWKIQVENLGNIPVNIERIELFNAGFLSIEKPHSPRTFRWTALYGLDVNRGSIQLIQPKERKKLDMIEDLAFFSNGWQSWSYSGVYGSEERFRNTRLGIFTAPMWYNPGTPRLKRPGLLASDMFGVLGDRSYRTGILLGFLSQKQHFGTLEAYLGSSKPALRLWANGDSALLAPGEIVSTDWAYIQFLHMDSPDALGPYMEAVAREHNIVSKIFDTSHMPTGWCSWYHFFQDVTADDIRTNLGASESLKFKLPLDMIQIDDGYESKVGDWLTFDSSFPEGVAPLAAEIRKKGFTPGLWIAPFIVHPKSQLYKNHPDWLLRGRFNRPVNAGFIWNTFTTALDLTHPDALAYVHDVIHTAAHEWGFPFLKLDFLYAAAIRGNRRDTTRTRAQTLRESLNLIRKTAGDETILLGCGCPLGSAIGLVNTMRINPDVDPSWKPNLQGFEMFFHAEPGLPSTRNAIHNALTRAPIHNRWWINDPDCLLLDPEISLTIDEIQSLATVIFLTGGSLLLSDHLPDLPPERLKIAEALLPMIGKSAHVLDWFDSKTPTRVQLDLEGPIGRWHLLTLFNWEDIPSDLTLRLNEYYVDTKKTYYGREFWTGEVYAINSDQHTFYNVPAHGSILIALQSIKSYRPQYLGSNLHISQGLEVSSWEHNSSGLSMRLKRPGYTEGEIALNLPKPPKDIFLNEQPITYLSADKSFYQLPVVFDQIADIKLTWDTE
jgi:alpha-galactosidase